MQSCRDTLGPTSSAPAGGRCGHVAPSSLATSTEPVGMSDEHASTLADIAWQPDGARIATAAYGGVAY